MISEQTFTDVRIAATLNYTFPGLATGIYDGDRLVAEVAWPSRRLHPSRGLTVIRPCAFRQQVAAAWARHLNGQAMQFLDLTDDPIVRVRALAGGVHFPSGIIRMPLLGQTVYAFGTALDADSCTESSADIFEAFDRPEQVLGLGIQEDDETRISVVYAETTEHPDTSTHEAVIDVLEALIARFAVTRLLADLPSLA